MRAKTALLDRPKTVYRTGSQRACLFFLPVALALFFSLWGLRGVSHTDIVEIDAARHAMNGVFLHDLVRLHKIAHPVNFSRYYYAHFPSLSIPYHPPLFPAIESLFFLGFGINLLAARIAIAVFTAIAVLIFYRLVEATHGSAALAFACTAVLFSLDLSQALASEVMLEFPALVFVLLSIYCIRNVEEMYLLKTSLWFALFAVAAVWTKQTVFLGLLPVVYFVLSRKRLPLRAPGFWIFSAIFGLGVGALLLLNNAAWFVASRHSLADLSSLFFQMKWLGTNQEWPHHTIATLLPYHLTFYSAGLLETFGAVASAAAIAATAGTLIWSRRRSEFAAESRLYFAWAISVFLILFAIPAHDIRYAFFALPPLVVIGCTALRRVFGMLLPGRAPVYLLLLGSVLWAGFHLNGPPPYLRGPSEAARNVVNGRPQRVLYCGRANGSFIFAVRTLDPNLLTTVIRGDKLPPEIFLSDNFEQFAKHYGIQWIVLEQDTVPNHWNVLGRTPSRSMVFEREIRLASSRPDHNGRLRIYRFTDPSPNPQSRITLPNPIMGRNMQLDLNSVPVLPR